MVLRAWAAMAVLATVSAEKPAHKQLTDFLPANWHSNFASLGRTRARPSEERGNARTGGVFHLRPASSRESFHEAVADSDSSFPEDDSVALSKGSTINGDQPVHSTQLRTANERHALENILRGEHPGTADGAGDVHEPPGSETSATAEPEKHDTNRSSMYSVDARARTTHKAWTVPWPPASNSVLEPAQPGARAAAMHGCRCLTFQDSFVLLEVSQT